MDGAICTGAADCLYDFQSLLSGFLAIAAAGIGAWALFKTANAPIVAAKQLQETTNRRRASFGCTLMASEFRRIAGLARQAESTIRVVIGARSDVTDSVRQRTILPVPQMIGDWEVMSLVSAETVELAHEVRLAIEAHNFDMARAGGSFGDDNFQAHVKQQAASIQILATRLANSFVSEGRRIGAELITSRTKR